MRRREGTLCISVTQYSAFTRLMNTNLMADTENAVQETRVRQIIKAQGGDEEQILSQIRLFKVNTAAQFETMMLNLDTYLEDASMCIIDNVASHLRKNQNSIEQIKKIRKVSQALLRSAARYQIPILRTNTITMNGPTLGDSFGYSSTIRAEFKKGSWRLEKGEQGEGTFDLEVRSFLNEWDVPAKQPIERWICCTL